VDPIVTYTGSAPSVGTDTISFSFLQDYFDDSVGSWAGNYTESIPLSLSSLAGPGSSASGELFYDGAGVGPESLSGPGSSIFTQTTALDFGAQNTADTLSAAFNFEFVFGAGTQPNASAASVTPEPMTVILCGFGLVAVYGARRRNLRSRTAA
jgi:hypothetical protein